MIGGFDGTVVGVLLGSEQVVDEVTGQKRNLNPYESMLKALDQSVLHAVRV